MKLLKLLSFVQMCKFFSHFGIRTLLVLYMVESLKFSDSHAFGVNAVFCGLVELGGIFGGIIADRYLGLRRALIIGGSLLGIGYGCLFFEQGLFLSLGMIILGGSLFSSNIMAALGLSYTENDPRREKGFTIFYIMQNVGALLSTILCGVIATHYGFQLGFAVAALGMVVGSLTLFLYRDLLPKSPPIMKKKQSLLLLPIFLFILGIGALGVYFEHAVIPILPWITGGFFCFFAIRLLKDRNLSKERVRKLLIYLGGLILFFAAEDQICSSLILFAERETDRSIFGWMIPSSVIACINPIVIILFGTIIAKLRTHLLTPFFLVAIAFGSLALLCLFQIGLSIFGVLGMVVIVSLAELMIGPFVSSIASEVAAKGKSGMVMGMVPIAFSLAFFLSGGFSKMVTIQESVASLAIYGAGFGKIALVTLVGGIILQLFILKSKALFELPPD